MIKEYYNAELARKVKDENSIQFLGFVYRQWWHVLFDHSPALQEIPDSKKFLEKFLIYLGKKKTINERIHLYLLAYIRSNFKEYYSKKIVEELLTSFCTLWVRTNVSSNKSVIVYSKELNKFFLGTKSKGLGLVPMIDIFNNENFDKIKDLIVGEIMDDFDSILDYSSIIEKMGRYDEIR